MTKTYRVDFYKNYASYIQNSPAIYNNEDISRWGEKYGYFFRSWLPLKKDAKIGELACGSGRLLRKLKKLGYTNISAVDISAEQTELAREVLPDIETSNVIDWLKQRPDFFNCLISIDLIEHLDKDEVIQFLEDCYKSLKTEGTIILQTPNADSPMSMGIRYGDFSHELCFSVKSLTDLLLAQGFHDIEVREISPILWGFGIKSSIRYLIWQLFRGFIALWNLAETGSKGSKVYSRVFIIKAIK